MIRREQKREQRVGRKVLSVYTVSSGMGVSDRVGFTLCGVLLVFMGLEFLDGRKRNSRGGNIRER